MPWLTKEELATLPIDTDKLHYTDWNLLSTGKETPRELVIAEIHKVMQQVLDGDFEEIELDD